MDLENKILGDQERQEFFLSLIVRAWTAEAPQMIPALETLKGQAALISSHKDFKYLTRQEISAIYERAALRLYETQVNGQNFRAYFVPIPGLTGLQYELKTGFVKRMREKNKVSQAKVKEVEETAENPAEIEISRLFFNYKTAEILNFEELKKRAADENLRAGIKKYIESGEVEKKYIVKLFEENKIDMKDFFK